MDDLLGEVQSLKSTVAGCEDSLSQMGDKVRSTPIDLGAFHIHLIPLSLLSLLLPFLHPICSTPLSTPPPLSQLSGDMSGMAEKVKALEDMKLLAAKDSMGDAATGTH